MNMLVRKRVFRAKKKAESAKANQLKPYEYFRRFLSELPCWMDDNGNIGPDKLDNLMPWAEEMPEVCRKRH